MATIRRGVLQSFDNTTFTASVLLIEATSAFLTGIAVNNTVDNTAAIPGAFCAVLMFDDHNPNDSVVIAIYGNVGSYFPASPTPAGSINFVNGFRQLNGAVINSGSTQSLQITGNGGIPTGATAVFVKAYFTSATVTAYALIAPHNPNDINAYMAIGNLQVANATVNGNALVPLDSTGQLDIFAGNGNITVWLYTYGYTL